MQKTSIQELKDTKEALVKESRAELQAEIKLWNQQVKSIGEIECSRCTKKIVTYPFGGGYYRKADGSVICSKECLEGVIA